MIVGLRASHVRRRKINMAHSMRVLGRPDKEVLFQGLDIEGLDHCVILLIVVFLGKFTRVDKDGRGYLGHKNPRNARRR